MREFITTWKTDNNGASDDNQIMISTKKDLSYHYEIAWGDGLIDYYVMGDIKHTYKSAGTYTVAISGTFPRLLLDTREYDNEKLLSVEQWGDIKWRSMASAFCHCVNLAINATDAPDLSRVTSMYSMFHGASAFNQDISHWDVSSVTDMVGMFSSASAFNQDISNWDVSKVTNMALMFYKAEAFNQDISGWDVSAVTNMTGMFNNAHAFNQDISGWDVSSVTDIRSTKSIYLSKVLVAGLLGYFMT